MREVYLIIMLLLLSPIIRAQEGLVSHKETLKLMGTRFEITAMAMREEQAMRAVAHGIQEIERIESLISSWKADSQTTRINANAGIQPVQVDRELFDLIQRSLKVSSVTRGAFDISFGGIGHNYIFDRGEHGLPEDSLLVKSIAQVGWQYIVLNSEDLSVYLPRRGMKIGFGGIGKGYAANAAKKVMSAIEGVKGGVVNASGDLMIWGQNDKSDGWPIQIANPQNVDRALAWLMVKEGSVVTSGDYEQYFMHQGRRYAHIIDPRTGVPTTGIKSVTIVCPDAEMGDALATAVFVLGQEEGIALINSLKNVEALIINDRDEMIASRHLQLKYQK